MKKNNLKNIEVISSAISDKVGTVKFIEYGEDPSGNCPFLPETSTISYSGAAPGIEKNVKVTTLDRYFRHLRRTKFNPSTQIVIKIDVEGFEVQVLRGSSKFILKHKPYFSIDIHQSVDGFRGTNETACRQILGNYGYSFQMIGHGLLASPESNDSLL